MKNTKVKKIVGEIFLFFILIALNLSVTVAIGYFNMASMDEMIRNAIVTVLLVFATCVGLFVSLEKDGLLYDNAKHLGRFVFFVFLGNLLSVVAFFIPIQIYPVVFLAVALSLTSNGVVGMSAYMTILFSVMLASNGSMHFFYLYAITGLIAITLFKDIDYEFRYTGALVAAIMSMFVCETAFDILFEDGRLSLDSFVFPMINAFINCILLLILLKYYSKRVVHIYRDKYQEINDPEYAILTSLKKQDAKNYYQAIHTAYFCDKIARRIGGNIYLAKALGYYGKCEVFGKDADMEASLLKIERCKFPPEFIDSFRQLHEPERSIEKKEAAIALMADTVVSTISFFFEKDKEAVLDYKKVIDLIFKKKLDSGVLNNCELTCKEIESMKNLFIEENLYYDFLR